MSDPLAVFPKDDTGRLKAGLYHWIAVDDLVEAYEIGWQVPTPTDTFGCHHDGHGVLCHWPHKRPMVLPAGVNKRSEIVIIDLPLPPSVNSFQHDSRGRPLGNRSANVVHWRSLCNGFLMTQRRHPVPGDYELTLTLPETQYGKFDASNRVKPLEDYLQDQGLIENDRKCRDLHVFWGDVERDWCRVELRPARR